MARGHRTQRLNLRRTSTFLCWAAADPFFKIVPRGSPSRCSMDELDELASAVRATSAYARGPRIAEPGARIRAVMADFLYLLCAFAVFGLAFFVLQPLLALLPAAATGVLAWTIAILYSLTDVLLGGSPGKLNEGFVIGSAVTGATAGKPRLWVRWAVKWSWLLVGLMDWVWWMAADALVDSSSAGTVEIIRWISVGFGYAIFGSFIVVIAGALPMGAPRPWTLHDWLAGTVVLVRTADLSTTPTRAFEVVRTSPATPAKRDEDDSLSVE